MMPENNAMVKPEAASDDSTKKILAKLGGDPRVLALFEIALTAYRYLPDAMLNLRTRKPTRTKIIEAIEAFGFQAAPIPWDRFPKRFQKNRPDLQVFDAGSMTEAELEQYWTELIAAQTPDAPKKRRKGTA